MAETAIKDFKIKEYYTNLVRKIILSYLTSYIFQPMYNLVSDSPKATNALNSEETISQALKAGIIYYENNCFKAKSKFSNKISQILELYGAKYDKFKKAYILPLEKLPANIMQAISNKNMQEQFKYKQVENLLNEIEQKLPEYVEKMIFDKEIEIILDDAGREIKKNTNKITVIEHELDDNQKREIAKSYTNNLQFYIKNFENERIPQMRSKVQELALKGYRLDAVSEMLQKEYGIAQRKAKFLAQNETSIMLAEFKRSTYKKMGFLKFRWSTIMDGKERERHKELNGKIFYYDDPPYIDELKTKKGLPGEDYNCRCQAIPIMDDNPFSTKNYSYLDEEGNIVTRKTKDMTKTA